MPDKDFIDPRQTERRSPVSASIDVSSSEEIVDLMHGQDKLVAGAVYQRRVEVSRAIDLALDVLKNGGRLIYVGAGTSGRLGVLDASECPPTFGSDPEQVIGIIAGGVAALTRSQEGSEDDRDAAVEAVEANGVNDADFVVGIAASGTTPFVHAALQRANEAGSRTALITCSEPPSDLTEIVDQVIRVDVGPEVLTGSTRLKAGTATKMVLNMISTGAMIGLGKAYGNLMVDLVATSEKLVNRGERIVMEVCGVGRSQARQVIDSAGGSVKVAIIMQSRGVVREEAERLLEDNGGLVRRVIGDPPPVPR